MIVMDETSCMVDIARYFVEFSMQESCGKCVPCRAGTVQIHRILDRIAHGRASMDDLSRLESLSTYVREASLCGLGQNAPNAVFSTLRHFRDEYLAHVRDGVCPAGVCPMRAEEVRP
jgi:NADH:ubiquinone oxidoreductase subunit F (NADH-binding)